MDFSKPIKSTTDAFISLLFPQLCLACRKKAGNKDRLLCIHCELELPETGFHHHQENELIEKFYGRLRLEYAAAMYYFSKGNVTQSLIHQLKYASKPQVGEVLGQWYGEQLKDSLFRNIDCIIPVPLHPKKRQKRGYNQSTQIAKGLAASMKKEWYDDAVVRIINTSTQTKKSKLERFQNVATAFEISRAEVLKGKHILLVDDVITTGATLEACAALLLELPNTKVSVAAIGMAKSY